MIADDDLLSLGTDHKDPAVEREARELLPCAQTGACSLCSCTERKFAGNVTVLRARDFPRISALLSPYPRQEPQICHHECITQ